MDWNGLYQCISDYVSQNIQQYNADKAKDVMKAAYLDGWLRHCGLTKKGECHDWNSTQKKGSLLLQ